MKLLEHTPSPCLVCGMGNVPRNDRSMPEFVDLERDVNWNDPAILCEDCLAQAGGLIGLLSKDAMQELKQELRAKDRELHEAKAEMDAMKRRAKKIGVEFTGSAKAAA